MKLIITIFCLSLTASTFANCNESCDKKTTKVEVKAERPVTLTAADFATTGATR